MTKITHKITSELGNDFVMFDKWAEAKLSKEEFEAFAKLKQAEDPTEFNFEYQDLYRDWLIDQKIIHQVFHDGVEFRTNSHTDEVPGNN
jgi:hypothetical protein